jgi:transcriptional regulator with XRE-family HTH domain
MADSNFAARLKRILETKKLSRRALARALFVTPASVIKWLRGTVPRPSTVDLLTKRFGISKEWLMAGRGRMEAGKRVPLKSIPALINYTVELQSRAPLVELLKHYSELERESKARASAYREKWRQLYGDYDRLLRAAGRKFRQENADAGKRKPLHDTRIPVFSTAMARPLTLEKILKRVARVASEIGGQRKAAIQLGVKPQQLNDWLSRRYAPGGEATLRLLAWVQAKEAQLNKSPGGTRTPPGRNDPTKEIDKHEKPKSDQQKSSRKRAKKSIGNRSSSR